MYIDKDGQRAEWKDGSCDKSDVDAYLCMKGTSTSVNKYRWVSHDGGAEYSYRKSINIDTQEKARDACRDRNDADLVSITSQDVQDFLFETFGPFEETQVWIGANDKDNEGTWKWEKGEDWGYTNWKDGEPNGGSSKDCVFIERDRDGVWKDDSCDKDDVHGYICMWGTTTSVDLGGGGSGGNK